MGLVGSGVYRKFGESLRNLGRQVCSSKNPLFIDGRRATIQVILDYEIGRGGKTIFFGLVSLRDVCALVTKLFENILDWGGPRQGSAVSQRSRGTDSILGKTDPCTACCLLSSRPGPRSRRWGSPSCTPATSRPRGWVRP